MRGLDRLLIPVGGSPFVVGARESGLGVVVSLVVTSSGNIANEINLNCSPPPPPPILSSLYPL
jgi:hypothetical protein